MTTFEDAAPPAVLDPSRLAPLERALESINDARLRTRLCPSEFTCFLRSTRPDRPDVYGYEHRRTGGRLYLDADGRAYRLVAPRHPARGADRFLPYRKLSAALDRLGLGSPVQRGVGQTPAVGAVASARDTAGPPSEDAGPASPLVHPGEKGRDGSLHLV